MRVESAKADSRTAADIAVRNGRGGQTHAPDGRTIVDYACDGAVGTTVDVGNATWTNTLGDPELITNWTDPDFDRVVRWQRPRMWWK